MAQAQMDYILGVNATGYSYVTAVGTKSCQNPHNRVTVSDGIDETIPGFVVGGPNSGQEVPDTIKFARPLGYDL